MEIDSPYRFVVYEGGGGGGCEGFTQENRFDDLSIDDRLECKLTFRANRIPTRYFVFPVGYFQILTRVSIGS